MTPLTKVLNALLIAVLTATAAAPARAETESPAPIQANQAIQAGHATRDKDHKHVWVEKSKQEWVKPITRKELVGYDQNGKPIYKEVIVQPGYWKTITYMVCSVCGKKKN